MKDHVLHPVSYYIILRYALVIIGRIPGSFIEGFWLAGGEGSIGTSPKCGNVRGLGASLLPGGRGKGEGGTPEKF